MKKVAIIFILLLSVRFVSAQSFQQTTKYVVTTEINDQGFEQPAYVVNLVRSGEDAEKLSTLTIEDTELFEDIFISTLENPGLDGISEVIKMEIEYLACCAHVQSYYFLIDKDQNLISLPQISNVYCEDSNTDFQYIFPNQEYGIPNNILETQTFYTDASEIKYVNLKQSYTWNDNNYSPSAATAITSN